jgi:hypothetical protein
LTVSVADPGSLSRILIFVHPGSKLQEEKSEKKFVVLPFFCSLKSHGIENYFIFELAKKKIWASLQRILELFFTHQIFIKLSRIYVWDPGSKRHRIPDPDQQHC